MEASALAHDPLRHPWSLSPGEARQVQRQLAARVVEADELGPLQRIAGIDLGYPKSEDGMEQGRAAAVGAGIVNWASDYGTADIARTKETEFFGTPWEEKALATMIRQSPLTYAGKAKAATLFIHGEVDQRVPYSEAEQMYVALKKNGVPAKMIQYTGMPHSISGSWNVVHRMINELRWLDTYTKAKGVS